MLTCWPKGFLCKEEAEGIIEWLNRIERVDGETLTVEEEMAREKLEAALEASPTG